MFVSHYAAAFSVGLNVRRIVPGMRFKKYLFLILVDGRNMPTVCSGWLHQWIFSFGGRGATWLHCYVQETNIPFVCRQEESWYEFRLARMLWPLWRSILGGDTAQNLIVLHVDLCYFKIPFSTALFSPRCDHVQDSLNFEHRFRGETTLSTIFVPWPGVEPFFISIRDLACFYVSVNCPMWHGLELHLVLLVPASPFFAYYSNYAFENRLESLIFTIARSEIASSAALLFLQTAMERVLSTCSVSSRVQVKKLLLASLRLSVVRVINFMDIKKMVYDHPHDLVAVIVAWDTMKTVALSAISSFPAARWFPYGIVWGEASYSHCWKHLCPRSWVSASSRLARCHWIPYCRATPTWDSDQAQAIAFLNEKCFFNILRPSLFEVFEPVITSDTLSLLVPPPTSVLQHSSIETLRPDFPIHHSPVLLPILHKLM